MKRVPLVLAAIGFFSAFVLFALPTPTPTPPPAHDGPTLEITFSGMTLFIKNDPGPGYKVIVPVMRAHNHEAYIRFPVDDANNVTFDASEPFRCDRKWYRWAPLTADQLTFDPDSAIDVNSFDATGVTDWLVHLQHLAPGFDLNRNDYDQTNPVVGKVAAQMMVDRGTLRPLELESPHHPVRWKFQHGNETANPKVCGTSGIRWLLPIKKDTETISIVSSLKDHPHLTVKLDNGRTTKVTIGNSVVDGKSNDIECPSKGPMPKDPHFALFYKLLRTPGAKEYIPVRIIPEDKCGSGTVAENKSQRGSDCLGSQWP